MLLTCSTLKTTCYHILPRELFQPNPYGDVYTQIPAYYKILLTRNIQDIAEVLNLSVYCVTAYVLLKELHQLKAERRM